MVHRLNALARQTTMADLTRRQNLMHPIVMPILRRLVTGHSVCRQFVAFAALVTGAKRSVCTHFFGKTRAAGTASHTNGAPFNCTAAKIILFVGKCNFRRAGFACGLSVHRRSKLKGNSANSQNEYMLCIFINTIFYLVFGVTKNVSQFAEVTAMNTTPHTTEMNNNPTVKTIHTKCSK